MSEFTEQDYYRVRQEVERRKLAFYRPYPKQMEFHKAGATYRERLLRAGNQCITPWTFIQTPDATLPASKVFFEKDVRVLSWGGESECVAQISGGFLRGIEPAFRLVMESGRFVDCSSTHQILTEHGYLRIDQLMCQSDGFYLNHKAEDYQANCVAYGYLDDLSPQFPEDSAQSLPPSSSGALQRNLIFSQEDVEERIRLYTTISKGYDLHSIFAYGALHREALYALFSVAGARTDVLPLSSGHRVIQKLLSAISDLPRSTGESFALAEEELSLALQPKGFSSSVDMPVQRISSTQASQQFLCAHNQENSILESNRDVSRKLIFYPFSSPSLVGGEKIVAYVPLGYQPIIDCHVPNTNNYKAGGIYNHNCGKTMAAAAETAMHATGEYPEAWWEGKIFKKPPVIWCAGVTGEVVRDSIQRLLIGDTAGNPGFIMKENIIDVLPSRGVADLADTILVKHRLGGTSRIRLKYYEQGREKFQADSVDFGWADEEPPPEIYTEMLTRTNATKGIMCMTFTPLKGMSEVVRRFLMEPSPDRSDTNMTIMDVLHIAPEERKRIIDSYPAHEKEARINGTPILGSGRIFPIAESEITVKPFNVMDMPWYWMEIAGIDFGWDHPTAAAKLLYDPQGDVIYVTNVYKRREATPLIHAAALKPWGKELQWAWPHDGLQHDKGSGVQLKEQYQQQGLKMLAEKATFDDERSNGVEAGIAEMLMRMESGRFKVFSHLTEFFEEFRLYHRREGKVVKEFDDILSAARAGVMMLRYAQPIRPPASMVSGGGNFKSQYNPLSPDYIKKSLTERRK